MGIRRLGLTGAKATCWMEGAIRALLLILSGTLVAVSVYGQQQAKPATSSSQPAASASPTPGKGTADSADADTLDTTPPTDETEDGSNPNPGPAIVVAPRLPASAYDEPASGYEAPILKPVAANAGGDAQRQQINDECANLLYLAQRLKAEADKTNVNVLSVPVVRDAGEIGQLAHRMRDQMKPVLSTRK